MTPVLLPGDHQERRPCHAVDGEYRVNKKFLSITVDNSEAFLSCGAGGVGGSTRIASVSCTAVPVEADRISLISAPPKPVSLLLRIVGILALQSSRIHRLAVRGFWSDAHLSDVTLFSCIPEHRRLLLLSVILF